VLFETDGQKDDVRLDGVRQCFGNDPGADRGRIRCNAFWIARGRDGYFDAVAGKRLGQGLNIAIFRGCSMFFLSAGDAQGATACERPSRFRPD
jgi:hypothetical protein